MNAIRRAGLAAASLLVAFATTARAQDDDSVFAGRRCDRRLANLRLPALQEIGDSAALDGALRTLADGKSETNTVYLVYDRGGRLRRVTTPDPDLPKETRRAVETAVRSAARPLPGYPNKFWVGVERFADGRVAVVPGTVTCSPESGPTADAVAFIKRSADYTMSRDRKAVIQFWLEPDGCITEPRIVSGSGLPSLDLLALAAIQHITFKPALVGRTPVRTVMNQPFNF